MAHWNPKIPRNFPLTKVPRGYMARIAGKLCWIAGKVTPQEALAAYHRKAAALTAGVEPLDEPQPLGDAPTLHHVLNRWIIDRHADCLRGELAPITFAEYRRSAKRVDAIAGHYLTDDIAPNIVQQIYRRLASRGGIETAKRAIAHMVIACNHAADMEYCRPVRLSRRLTRKITGRARVTMKWRLYTPGEIQKILAAIDVKIDGTNGPVFKSSWMQLRAMVLLALNGGYGAKECADLPRAVVDLDNAIIDYSRGKTGMNHIVPLWPETVAALRAVLDYREGDELVFRTRNGTRWAYNRTILKHGKITGVVKNDSAGWLFGKLVCGLGLKIRGQGFYKLRHLHATTADKCEDRNAAAVLLGHSLGMRDHYVKVEIDRLRKVSEFVRAHLLLSPLDSSHSSPAA